MKACTVKGEAGELGSALEIKRKMRRQYSNGTRYDGWKDTATGTYTRISRWGLSDRSQPNSNAVCPAALEWSQTVHYPVHPAVLDAFFLSHVLGARKRTAGTD